MLKALAKWRVAPRERFQRSRLLMLLTQGCANPGLKLVNASGVVVRTNNNATDFFFVSTNGMSAGAGQRLGSPGPQNFNSPRSFPGEVHDSLLDRNVAATSPPNRVRDFTSNPANNSTFGTLELRRRLSNSTGLPLLELRFRIIDMTTSPAPVQQFIPL